MDHLRHAEFSRHAVAGEIAVRVDVQNETVDGVLGKNGIASNDYRSGGVGAGHLFAVVAGSLRQECSIPAARLVARCDGGSHTGQRADSCSDDGHGRGLHDRAVYAAIHGRRPRRS